MSRVWAKIRELCEKSLIRENRLLSTLCLGNVSAIPEYFEKVHFCGRFHRIILLILLLKLIYIINMCVNISLICVLHLLRIKCVYM